MAVAETRTTMEEMVREQRPSIRQLISDTVEELKRDRQTTVTEVLE